MTEAFIGFGGNLSNPKQSFLSAVDHLREAGVEILAKSRLWSSPAWPPGAVQPDYINAAVKAGFDGSADALLSILQQIERALGRTRTVKNAARTLDLDLLTFGSQALVSENLILPHPRMLDRAFVLLPLCEIDAGWLNALARLPPSEMEVMRYVGDW